MTCAEFKEEVALYAVGALDAAERAALESHLAQPGPHQDCAASLGRAQRTASALGRGLAPLPVEKRVWEGIEARLGFASSRRSPPRWPLWSALAAAVIAVVVLGLAHLRSGAELEHAQAALLQSRAQLAEAEENARRAQAKDALALADCSRDLTAAKEARQLERAAAALLEEPGTRVVPLGPAGPKKLRASAIVNPGVKRAYVLGTALPALTGKDYELWVIHGKGAPEPAGLLRAAGGGILVGEVDAKLLARSPDALAVSIENTGGVAVPTDVEMLGKLGT